MCEALEGDELMGFDSAYWVSCGKTGPGVPHSKAQHLVVITS